jgi:putative ABC transport system permease protein
VRELRDAVRQWARTPVITVVVVLSLALGIGANTAIFSLIDSLLLRPLPVHEPGRLVRIQEGSRNHGIPVWRQLQEATPILDGTAAMSLLRPDISSTPERRSAFGLAVTGTFFDLLGVTPAIGRLLTAADDQPGSPAVAVTDYHFWQSSFGGRPDIVGAVIHLDGMPFTIVGVTERGFFGLNIGRRFDVAVGLNGYRTLYPNSLDSVRNSFSIIGRLHPGQAPTEAEAALRVLQPQIRAALQIPDDQPLLKEAWSLQPVASGIIPTTQERYAQPLTVLMALVAMVLLIACANVANLLLARSSARRGELAVRSSLGASRWQLLRSTMMESLVIALAGAAAAVLVGAWTARAIVNAVAVNESGAIATWIDVPLNYRVLGFTIAAGIATAIAFGIGPALWATRVDPLDVMRQRARGTVGSRPGIMQALVAFQVALAFVLVLGGALLVRSFIAMTTQDLGFSARQVVVAVPDFSRGAVARNQRVAVAERLREQMSGVAGVEAAGLVESSPFGLGYAVVPIEIGSAATSTKVSVPLNRIGDGFFDTIGMRMKLGRGFEPIGRETPQSAIVNEAFASRYFPGANPIGQTIRLGRVERPAVEVVGVVGDARFTSLRDPVPPALYVSFLPADEPWIEINVRSRLPESEVKAQVLSAAAAIAPGVGVEFRSLQAGMAYFAARDRVIAWLAGGFAALALLLSAIGLYGVMSDQVIRRRQEFGVRVAIGAAPSSVTMLILRQAGIIVAMGLLVGLAGSLASGRLIASLLYEVTPADPISIATAAAFLSAVTALAGVIPARRAARVDPMVALREE